VANVQQTAARVARAPVGYFKGFTYPFKGAGFVYFKHPELIRFWIVPIVITFLALVLAVWGSWEYSDAITNSFWEQDPDSWFDWLHDIVDTLFFVILLFTSVFVLLALSSAIAAPFNAMLSLEVERLLTGIKTGDDSWGALFRDIWRTVLLEILKLMIYAGVMLPLFCCSLFVPGIGQILMSIFGFLFTAVYWGVDYIDYPAERRGWKATKRLGAATKKFFPVFGFGTGVWLFLFVPVVNLLFMPAAVAGGTMMFIDMEGPAPPQGYPPQQGPGHPGQGHPGPGHRGQGHPGQGHPGPGHGHTGQGHP